MTQPSLFITSVYAPSAWNCEWYRLQRKHIEQNTPNIRSGSRHFEFRVMDKYRYCEHWWNKEGDDALAEQLRSEPFTHDDKFLQNLMALS